MFINNSLDNNYPKTLLIRNQQGGMVWQIYNVQTLLEAEKLSKNSEKNGFEEATLVDFQPGLEETWPDWRETFGGKEIIKI